MSNTADTKNTTTEKKLTFKWFARTLVEVYGELVLGAIALIGAIAGYNMYNAYQNFEEIDKGTLKYMQGYYDCLATNVAKLDKPESTESKTAEALRKTCEIEFNAMRGFAYDRGGLVLGPYTLYILEDEITKWEESIVTDYRKLKKEEGNTPEATLG